ncbi:MAG: hypothetical protein WBL88_08180 [Nitrososphaeraceae archaeon]
MDKVVHYIEYIRSKYDRCNPTQVMGYFDGREAQITKAWVIEVQGKTAILVVLLPHIVDILDS